MIIGIIGAMDLEISLLKSNMTNLSEVTVANQSFFLGSLSGKTVVLTSSGIGKVNSAISAQLLISAFNVTHLINTGIAGNMSSSLGIGDMVASTSVTYHDFNLEFLSRYYPFVSSFSADAFLLESLQSVIKEMAPTDFSLACGLIVTGDVFLEDSVLKGEIKDAFSPLCIEMEGASIAHCAAKNDIPFLILRCISDSAQEDAKELYDNFFQVVADRSAQVLMALLSKI